MSNNYNYTWARVRAMKPSHYRLADRYVGLPVLVAGLIGAFLPWGGA